MQAVAMLLIAVSAGANPWDTPQAAEQTAPGQARVDAPWDGDTALDDHQYQLDLAARRKTEPVAPAPMNRLQQNPYRGVQPATNNHTAEANRKVRLAQFVENDAWPTAGTAAAAARDNNQNVVGGNPPAAQRARSEYLDTYPAAKQPAARQADSFGSQQTESGFVLPSAENRVPATIHDPYRLDSLDRSDETRRYPPSSQRTTLPAAGPAAGIPATTDRPANANTSDEFDSRGGGFRQSTADRLRHPAGRPAMQDPYVTYQSDNANPQQLTSTPTRAYSQPLQTPRLAETPTASPSITVPPVLTNANIKSPAEAAPAMSNPIEVTADSGETTKVAPTLAVATDPNTYTRGGGTLLLLAFFASVGLNFYLGWIAWDTYNRYQDMVSDIRYSNTSARRERVERERDLVDRRSAGDRHLVDSAAY